MPAMKFPCKLESGLGRFRTMSEAEEIAQSVRMILLTHRGERPYRPEFGSDLSRYAFENVDTTLRTLIRQETTAALRKWEPRIFNIQVTFEQNLQEGALLVNVSYEILSTGASAQVSVPLNIL